LPITDRFWLDRASFGSDRIVAQEDIRQFSQRLQRFGVTDFIVVGEEYTQFSQGL
jgi:wobble nucleotide-excising tRNase